MKNKDCDADKCRDSRGEVRLYTGGPRALYLCSVCWAHESARRRHRNPKLPIEKWSLSAPVKLNPE
jgi:hypothetical protein